VAGAEKLPAKGHGLLILLDALSNAPAISCGELAERWVLLEKMPQQEADAFARDVEESRRNLPPPTSAWD
jgi:hypothetical protein